MRAPCQASALSTGLLQAQAEALLAFCALLGRVGCLLRGHTIQGMGRQAPIIRYSKTGDGSVYSREVGTGGVSASRAQNQGMGRLAPITGYSKTGDWSVYSREVTYG